jgi:hypothetical protein
MPVSALGGDRPIHHLQHAHAAAALAALYLYSIPH